MREIFNISFHFHFHLLLLFFILSLFTSDDNIIIYTCIPHVRSQSNKRSTLPHVVRM
jgi:hypothetical protein